MSLPSCFKHHPDQESDIVIDNLDGVIRRRCKVCTRIRTKAAYHRKVKRQPTATGHGDLLLPRLTWTAPKI